MTAIILALAVFAAYRSASLVVYERGPWSLAEALRSWVANRYGPGSWQHEGVNCVLCVSFWLSLPWAIIAHAQTGGGVLWLLLLWWGIAGAVTAMHNWLAKR